MSSILQVSTSDVLGGAERIAYNLLDSYESQGHTAWLAVGKKHSNDPRVVEIPHDRWRTRLARHWISGCELLKPLALGYAQAERLLRGTKLLAQPQRLIRTWSGQEDFDFPGTAELLRLVPTSPDIIHCHNLHGGFFDLSQLPTLCKLRPVILTLHDSWLLSGHCAHSFGCERWKAGCGTCPDLTIYPAIRRDATSYNWERKRNIFAESLFYVATPSQWLLDKVKESMLAPAVQEMRVIQNGIDLSVFRSGERLGARQALNLPRDAKILLSTGKETSRNIWKDFRMLREAVAQIGTRLRGERVVLVCLGEKREEVERIGYAEIWYVPYQRDSSVVARYYQAADVYLHAAKEDTFPSSILEAMATGTPVVASGVGGILEQVEDMRTGFLVQPGNADEMGLRLYQILTDEPMRKHMSARSIRVASERFNLEAQADRYLDWYHEILTDWHQKNRELRES